MKHVIAVLSLLLILVGSAQALDDALVAEANDGMSKAVTYLRTKVAYGGGYLGSYKADLSDQWGEGHATRTQNWIQPPGCPSVGFAFLRAWEATGDQQYLDGVREVAHSLVYGQLECGGWDYIVDHAPEGAKRWFYHHNANSDDATLKQGRNTGTFDDNVTQHATRLLIAADLAFEQQDEAIHDAALYALEYHLKSQAAEGGWPQRFPLSGRSYGDFFTFNDNSIADCIDVMMIAYGAYGDQRYRDAVVKAGDFIVKAQLPEPQPIWAQQYDLDVRPAWARRFEPASVTAGESVGVMRTVVKVALFLEDEKYLQPIPPALAWYKRSELTGADKGRWARFYELGTNKPLYFEAKTYLLTYDDSNVPDHYSFKGARYPARVEQQCNAIQDQGLAAYKQSLVPQPLTPALAVKAAEGMEESVRQVLAAQDDQGRWVQGDMIDMQTFERNIQTLAQYIGLATK